MNKFFCVRVYGIEYFAFADLDRGVYLACSADGAGNHAHEKRGCTITSPSMLYDRHLGRNHWDKNSGGAEVKFTEIYFHAAFVG